MAWLTQVGSKGGERGCLVSVKTRFGQKTLFWERVTMVWVRVEGARGGGRGEGLDGVGEDVGGGDGGCATGVGESGRGDESDTEEFAEEDCGPNVGGGGVVNGNDWTKGSEKEGGTGGAGEEEGGN